MSDARAEGWNLLQIIKARPTTCPRWTPREAQSKRRSFLCFATFQSSQAQIRLCPRQIHPEPHLRETPAVSVNAEPFRQKHQRAQTKVRSAAIWSTESPFKKKKKKKPGTTRYTSNKTLDSFQSPRRERQTTSKPLHPSRVGSVTTFLTTSPTGTGLPPPHIVPLPPPKDTRTTLICSKTSRSTTSSYLCHTNTILQSPTAT